MNKLLTIIINYYNISEILITPKSIIIILFMKKYKGHRNIPPESKEEIKQQFEEKLKKSNKRQRIN